MKLLWVKADFLHPTTRGGQIRTLETLKRLHRRHEVHYLALHDGNPEALERASEYCSVVHPVPHRVPEKNTVAFAGQLLAGVVSPLPVAVSRYRSQAMTRAIQELSAREHFDSTVCDFLFPAPNFPDLSQAVLFAHNVEAEIWRRHVEHARTPLHRAYFRLQAERMFRCERDACRRAKGVIAVSDVDAATIRDQYNVRNVAAVPTGVDVQHFAPPPGKAAAKTADLVFLGSMDWMPNIDGAVWFVREVLPRIRTELPDCTVALVGRKPSPVLSDLASTERGIKVTGTVPDVRPWLWGSRISIVPLRIGGGTRLKIFEAMAANVPVISTTIGAEGLPVRGGEHLLLADDASGFANACVALLRNEPESLRLAGQAQYLVASKFSWDAVSHVFESRLLASNDFYSEAPRLGADESNRAEVR